MKTNSLYHFTDPQLLAELDRFTATLSVGEDNLKKYRNYLGRFLAWLNDQQLQVEAVRAADVLAFIASIKDSTSINVQHNTLYILRQYFDYKQHPHNPTTGIRIRKKPNRILHDVLDRKTLDSIYKDHQVLTQKDYLYKVVIGLVVFQGLSCDDLHRVNIDDVHLKKGEIHVPGAKWVNPRTLPLEGFQIIELHEYLQAIRPILLGRNTNRQLIISSKGNPRIKNMLTHLMKALRSKHPKVKNLMQLRKSVIAAWLKDKDVRIVQYMVGHMSVKSTEQYQVLNLEDLQEQLNKFHPLG